MRSLQILSALASYVGGRMDDMRPNRYIEDIEKSYELDVKEAIQILDITRRLLVEEYRLTQREKNKATKCLEPGNTVGLESLPTELLRIVVGLLPFQDIKQLSRTSKRLRGVCLPSLFRSLKFEFSQAGFEQLKTIVESDIRYHVVSFTYIVPDLLRSGKYLLCYDEPGLTLPRNTRFRSLQVRDLDP
jgi:hypothetical protein